MPGTLLYIVRHHIDNVRRRYSAVDIEVATSTDFKPQTNSDNAL